MYWITPDGSYYEGLHVAEGSLAVPQRPSTQYLWSGSEWLINPDALMAENIEKIRAIERAPTVSDAMQRGSRLVALAYALDDLIRVAAAKGQTVTRQQAHDWAMLNDGNYKTLYEAEQTIKPLRALV